MNCNYKNLSNKKPESVYLGVGEDYIDGFISNIVIDDCAFAVCYRLKDTNEHCPMLVSLSIDMIRNIDLKDLKYCFDIKYGTNGSEIEFNSAVFLRIFNYVLTEFNEYVLDIKEYEAMLEKMKKEYCEITDEFLNILEENKIA